MYVKIRKITDSVGVDTNGEGVSRNYFFAGCSAEPKCEMCHNPGLWTQKVTDTTMLDELHADIGKSARNGLTSHIVFLGGEPLDQAETVFEMVRTANMYGMTTWLYTGRAYKDVPVELQKTVDVIVAGKYDESLATGGFPASFNQEVVRRNPRNPRINK